MIPDRNFSENTLLPNTFNISQKTEGVTKASQQAKIAHKRIDISLIFEGNISAEEAQQTMNQSFEKVNHLALIHRLGEMNEQGETTLSLVLHQDSKLTRNYTVESSHSNQIKQASNEIAADFLGRNSPEINAVIHIKAHTQDAAEVTKALPKIPEKIEKLTSKNPWKNPELSLNTVHQTQPTDREVFLPEATFDPPPKLSAHANSPSPIGKVFTDKFKMRKNDVATEKAVRAETVATMTNGMKAKLDYLNNQLAELEKIAKSVNGTDGSDLEIANHKERIAGIESDLQKYGKYTGNATHGSVNMPRFIFRAFGRERAKAEMAPILTNLRMQTVEDSKGNTVSRVSRSGAITDFRNGEVSLQELRDLKDLDNFQNLSGDRKNQLEKMYLKNDRSVSGNSIENVAFMIKTKALVGYGSQALISDLNNQDAVALMPLITKLQSSKNLEKEINAFTKQEADLINKVKIDPVRLDNVMSQRSDFLKQLVLQDLQLHLQTHPMTSEGPILYCRTAVVDLNKQALNSSGCVIHERTQGLDTKAIFDELKDAVVVFDCVGKQSAFIDDNGRVHMPKECGEGATTLNPIFFNICVQGDKGHTLNVGMQKQINDETLDQMRSRYGNTPEFKDLQRSFSFLQANGGDDPNQTVLLVSKLIEKQDGYMGINCFGAKDRTGYVCALITHAKVLELAQKENPDVKPTDPEMVDFGRHLGHQLLNEFGVAAQIAQDNADHTTLKITRYDLSLYDTSTNKGKMLRAAHAINGVCMVLVQRLQNALGMSSLQVSSTPGQIYKDEYQTALPPSLMQRMQKAFERLIK